jgi:predicted nucleic acid-binding protein
LILVDTSIWIEHLRNGEPRLAQLLDANQVLGHAFVVGELALGQLGRRKVILDSLRNLPQAHVASDPEVLRFIETAALHGLGIGYVDAHLLAATRLTPECRLWTRDRKLQGVAERLGVCSPP